MTPRPPFTPEAALAHLLGGIDAGSVVVVSHDDADGRAAAVVLARALEGDRHVEVRLVRRFEDPWSDAFGREIAARQPSALILADLGVHPAAVLRGTPTLVIDHHVPRGWPSDV